MVGGHDAATTWSTTQESATVVQIVAQYPRELAGFGNVTGIGTKQRSLGINRICDYIRMGIKAYTELCATAERLDRWTRDRMRAAGSVADANRITAQVKVPPPVEEGYIQAHVAGCAYTVWSAPARHANTIRGARGCDATARAQGGAP